MLKQCRKCGKVFKALLKYQKVCLDCREDKWAEIFKERNKKKIQKRVRKLKKRLV